MTAQRFFCDAIRRMWSDLRHGRQAFEAQALLLSRCGAFLPAAMLSPLDFRPVIWYPLL
ncbi:hypothetical protein SS05631_c33320 [Sinorhizobium sp. CCBAU 05631]|nr:hypothetical protein SS05631_c33320 [Sinorhizobium sp. CCBAU 05631]